MGVESTMSIISKRRKVNLAEERVRRKERSEERYLKVILGDNNGMYPLNAPGMPPPGPDFLWKVHNTFPGNDDTVFRKKPKTRSGDPGEFIYEPSANMIELHRRALREPRFSMVVEVRKGVRREVYFVPGHIWAEGFQEWADGEPIPVTGPQRADVMVISKVPWIDETLEGRNFISETGKILIDMCHALGIKGLPNWYITNLVKFMPPDGTAKVRAGWVADCLPFLHQELRIVRPKYVLCLGAEASNALLGGKYGVGQEDRRGKNFGVGVMDGRVVEYSFYTHACSDEKPRVHTAQVMTVLHPAQISRDPTQKRVLEKGLSRWKLLLQGHDFRGEEEGLDHRTCISLEEAQEWVHEAALEMANFPRRERILGVDAEWQGKHAVNANANVVTLQISWAPKKAICFHLRDEKNRIVFRDSNNKPAIKRLAKLLNPFVNRYRVAGHFFVPDLEMLQGEGFDFRAGYAVPM